MGFNRQRPDSLNAELKRISVEFCPLGQDEVQQAIDEYVSAIAYGKANENVCLDDWRLLSSVSQSTREHQRIKFTNCFVHAITVKACNSKVIKIRAELVDLGAGGACIAIPETLKVIGRGKKESGDVLAEVPNIKIKLDFLDGLVVKGVIRRLKPPKLDPAIDLDNFDFENTLPQYWKVNG